MEESKIVVMGNEYSIDEAVKRMRAHLSWLYWIAGLSLANLVYILLDQGYFMVAGLGMDSFAAYWFAASEEQFTSIQLPVGFALVVFFLVSGYLGIVRNKIVVVIIATAIYTFDAILFATIYFDIMSLLFHIWATVSLVQGVMFMIQLKYHGRENAVNEKIT